jgi:Cu2+-exporting ATPase
MEKPASTHDHHNHTLDRVVADDDDVTRQHQPPLQQDAMEHAAHGHDMQPTQHDHAAHVDHSGHEQMFRRRFWVSLVLTIPVLLFSPMIQEWFGFSMPEFPGSQVVGAVFAVAIFFYGGLPFLQMAVPEVQNRKPGMMLLISLAITVAFLYSLFALFVAPMGGFFWEMATLIDIMLLGHWLEMRSVRQASGALKELGKLMPDTS